MAMVQQAQAVGHQEQQQEEEEACGPIPIAQLEVRSKAGFVVGGKQSFVARGCGLPLCDTSTDLVGLPRGTASAAETSPSLWRQDFTR